MSVLGSLSAPRREVRVGTVVSVAGSVATVDIGGSLVDADIPATPTFTLTAADTVYVIPVGDTWLIFASQS